MSVQSWIIRHVLPADAVEVARLATLLGYPSDATAMLERLGRLQGSADHRIAVATMPGESSAVLGGWVHVARRATLESGEFAEILGLVVDRAARRGGIGRALVGDAERWAQAQGLPRLTVRCNVARVESHDFYAALEFARVKTQQVYSKSFAAATGNAV